MLTVLSACTICTGVTNAVSGNLHTAFGLPAGTVLCAYRRAYIEVRPMRLSLSPLLPMSEGHRSQHILFGYVDGRQAKKTGP